MLAWLPAVAVPRAGAQALPDAPLAPLLTNQTEVAIPTQAVVAVSVTQLVAEAEAFVAAGKKEKARDRLLAALETAPDEAHGGIESILGKLNVELVREPWPLAEKTDYIVQEGDSIKAIAQRFGTTVEVIVEGNQLKRPDIIKPGERLRVFTGKLAIVVSKTRNDLLVTCNGRFFKRYRVGTGKFDRTPVGAFSVSERIKEPPWWRAGGKTIPYGDKENILGTRWIALKATGETAPVKGIGIHGTWDPGSIGKTESAGCIRLVNEDVEELFGLIPIGTEVVIEE
jgi:lipoprotein-anchoring transpeptidase ErfK/SrfK